VLALDPARVVAAPAGVVAGDVAPVDALELPHALSVSNRANTVPPDPARADVEE